MSHTTMRGRGIDFNSLIRQHATTVALGNANMNAKGDIIGQGGAVLKTQEQVEAEWAAARKRMQDSVPTNIKDPTVVAAPIIAAESKSKPIIDEDRDFEPILQDPPVKTTKRKITESDA